MASWHFNDVCGAVTAFVGRALQHVTGDEQLRSTLQENINDGVERSLTSAREELEKIAQDEKQQPITYNHYFPDNLQKARLQASQSDSKRAGRDECTHGWGTPGSNKKHAVNLLQNESSHPTRIQVDMDNQACTEALAALNAYYKVWHARKSQMLGTWLTLESCSQDVRRQRVPTSH